MRSESLKEFEAWGFKEADFGEKTLQRVLFQIGQGLQEAGYVGSSLFRPFLSNSNSFFQNSPVRSRNTSFQQREHHSSMRNVPSVCSKSVQQTVTHSTALTSLLISGLWWLVSVCSRGVSEVPQGRWHWCAIPKRSGMYQGCLGCRLNCYVTLSSHSPLLL